MVLKLKVHNLFMLQCMLGTHKPVPLLKASLNIRWVKFVDSLRIVNQVTCWLLLCNDVCVCVCVSRIRP